MKTSINNSSNSNIITSIFVAFIVTFNFFSILGSTALAKEGIILNDKERKDVFNLIATTIRNDDKKSPRLKNLICHEKNELINITYFDHLALKDPDKNVTVQYFPVQEGIPVASITIFVTQKVERWSVSMNEDGSLRSGVGKNKDDTMILDISPKINEAKLAHWQEKINPVLEQLERIYRSSTGLAEK